MVVIPQWLRVLIKCGASIKVWIYIDVIDISTLFKKINYMVSKILIISSKLKFLLRTVLK